MPSPDRIPNRDSPQRAAESLLILDISRLVYATWTRTPTGIPRVELAYARHFIAKEPDRLRFVVLDAIGRLRIVKTEAAIGFVRAISAYWNEGVSSTGAYARLILRALRLYTGLLLRPGNDMNRLVAGLGSRVIYVIPSQLQLERSAQVERLKQAGDVKIVYFVHDILPALMPDYFEDGAPERTRRRLTNAARLVDAIVANSQATADAFRDRFGQSLPPSFVTVAPLGVNRPARPSGTAKPPAPYFVMLGTIEPRKNHLLILQCWRNLLGLAPDRMPTLVVIGSRGWKNREVFDILDRPAELQGFVREHGKVADTDVTELLMGARALLMPSLAEGFGLPLSEALAVGTPVICSDISVFREVGAGVPDYLDPADEPAWRAAILDYSEPDSLRRRRQLRRLAAWSPPTWRDHFKRVEATLGALEN
ncbi:glycosyltransferase family 4 protein [Reyranella sp.]|uniref:glycosyltransferase family 4 protein n=1 Tax=Reyranella sp. TaxID=1929291 RepID=UPI003BAA6BBE